MNTGQLVRRLARSIAISAVVFIAAGARSTFAAPLLLGHTLETTYLFPDETQIFAGPSVSIVSDGAELLDFAGFVDIDFSDTRIVIRATRDGIDNTGIATFDGLRIRDVDVSNPIAAFTMVLIDSSSTLAGFDASRVNFDADSVFLDFLGLPIRAGQVLSLDVVALSPPVTVPEPSAVVLFGAAFLFLRRRAGR